MTAQPREELLSAYLDDELSPDERAQVEQWLVENSEYRRQFEELRGLRADLRALPRHKLTEDLGPAVLRKAERSVLGGRERVAPAPESLPGSSVARWWARGRSARMLVWPAVAVAAALLVALFNTRDEGERELARKDDSLKEARDGAPASGVAAESLSRIQRSSEISDLAKDSTEPLPAMKVAPPADQSAEVQAPAVGTEAAPYSISAQRRGGGMGRQAPQATEGQATAPPRTYNLPPTSNAPNPQPPQRYGYTDAVTLKVETDARRALANRDQVNFIQCDVTPGFMADKQMEKVLADSKLEYTLLETPQSLEQAQANQAPKPSQSQAEVRYACEATPEQVGQIVTELEQERSRKRVSNLIFGLGDNEQRQTEVKVPPAQAEEERLRLKLQQQQPVTIYLRSMQDAQDSAAAAPQPAQAVEPRPAQ